MIVERLSGAFHLQPIKFPVAFSSVRRGSTVFWLVDKLTKFNPGAKKNHFYFKGEIAIAHSLRTSHIGEDRQFICISLRARIQFSAITWLFSCYNKALATFALEWLTLFRIPAILRGHSDSITDRRRMRVKLAVGEERRSIGVYKVDSLLWKMSNGTMSDISVSVSKYRYLG